MTTDNIEINKRLRKVLKNLTIILLLGICYLILLTFTELSIPCLFNKITGLYCPGCGITRMCLAILQFDFVTAFHSNMALFILLPFLIPMFCYYIVRYILTGRQSNSVFHNTLLWLCIGFLLVFGVLRNLPMFYFLAP